MGKAGGRTGEPGKIIADIVQTIFLTSGTRAPSLPMMWGTGKSRDTMTGVPPAEK